MPINVDTLKGKLDSEGVITNARAAQLIDSAKITLGAADEGASGFSLWDLVGGAAPGTSSRDNLKAELGAMSAILEAASPPDGACVYSDRAKNDYLQAFREVNTVEGMNNQSIDTLQAVGDAASNPISTVASAVGDAAGSAAKGLLSGLGVTGVLFAAAGIGVVLFVIFKGPKLAERAVVE